MNTGSLAGGSWRWWPSVGAVRWEPSGDEPLFPLHGDLRIEQWLQCVQPLDRKPLLASLRTVGRPGAGLALRFRAVDSAGHERWVGGEARCEVDRLASMRKTVAVAAFRSPAGRPAVHQMGRVNARTTQARARAPVRC